LLEELVEIVVETLVVEAKVVEEEVK